jgi:hypothetical protein
MAHRLQRLGTRHKDAMTVNASTGSSQLSTRAEREAVPREAAHTQARAVLDNEAIARALEACADLLEVQDANLHFVRAYRTAAASIRASPTSVAQRVLSAGPASLQAIDGIGPHIARAVEQLARSGHWAMLDRLRGELKPEKLFTRVPGIGLGLAERIHHALGIETLEELEIAAHDGRLEKVRGLGPRRAASVRNALAVLLARQKTAAQRAQQIHPSLSVDALLALDARYRERAAKGELHLIAPRRFNPKRRAWLPVMHDEAEGHRAHILYSNTALAHKLQRTHDWVVIYDERDGAEGQHTIVTEQRGLLRGKRVVRGREHECADYYGTSGGCRTAHHR